MLITLRKQRGGTNNRILCINVCLQENFPMARNTAVSAVASTTAWPVYDQAAGQQSAQDHFVSRNGIEFAGIHLIIDLWEAENLDNLQLMEAALREAVEVSGATLLHIHLHHFTPSDGISGVAVLAESHISVHTWPERGFAAFDIFMCGDTEPEQAIPVLKSAFNPGKLQVTEQLRGMSSD
jgi:S-adenosylmethionine decarboxylase